MYQQMREACALLALTKQHQPDITPTTSDLAAALENLVRAADEHCQGVFTDIIAEHLDPAEDE